MKLSEVKKLKHGQTCHHKKLKNADGTPLRGRVSGKVKTWKRDNKRVKVPMKHGLYDNFYLSDKSDTMNENYQDWLISITGL